MATSPWLGIKRNTYGLGLPQMQPQQVTQEDLNMLAMNQPQAPVQQQPEAFGYTPFLQTPEGQKIALALEAQRQGAIDSQNQSLQFAQGQLESVLSKKKDIDLLPIAALVDTWSGSNMAPYFQNAKDKNAEIALALQQEILKGRQGLVGSQADMMKDRLGMGSDEQKLRAVLSKDKYLSDAELKAKRDLQMSNLTSEEERARLNRENALDIAKLNNASRIAAAKTTAGRAQTGDQFRSTDQQLKVTNDVMKSKQAEMTAVRSDYVQALNNYEKAIEGYNPSILQSLTPSSFNEKKAAINQAYQTFIDKGKNAAQLGALTGSDLNIMTSQLPNVSDVIQSLGGKDQVTTAKKLLNQLKMNAKVQNDADINLLNKTYGKFGAGDTVRELDNKFKNSYSDTATPTMGNKALPSNPSSNVSPSTREQKIEAIKKLQGGR